MAEWIGKDIGAGVCVITVDFEPGQTVALHTHPYEEVFVVHDGEAEFEIDGEKKRVAGGQLAVAPANSVHGFTALTRLRQTDIHVSPEFVTRWL